MKKATILLSILMLVLLAACGGPAPKDTTDSNIPPTSEDQSKGDNSPSPDLKPKGEASIATFGASADRLVSALRESVSDGDFPDLFSEEPKMGEQEATENMPAAKTYAYTIETGAMLILYETADTGELYQAFLSFSSESLPDDSQQRKVGHAVGLIEAALEPDLATRQAIDEELNLSNTSTDATTVATGSVATWSYSVYDGVCMLNVMAK